MPALTTTNTAVSGADARAEARLRQSISPSIADQEMAHATPGESAVLVLGPQWNIFDEHDVDLSDEQTDGFVKTLRYQTVVLRNPDDVMLAFRVNVHEGRDPGRYREFNWNDLTGRQRMNGIMAALDRRVLGQGPDGLFTALADAVEHRVHGDDPTNWLDAARMLLADAKAPGRDPEVGAALDAAMFLAGLTSPRFAALMHAR